MTERIQPNPFDDHVAAYVDVIRETVAEVRKDGRNVRPYGDGFGPAEKLSDDEEWLLFSHPAEHVRLRWPEMAVDQATGLPITNAQATQVLLQKMGPTKYVQYVLDGQKLTLKRGGLPNV